MFILVLFDLFCEFGPRWLTQTPTGLDPSGVGLSRGTNAYGWFVLPPPPGVLVVFFPYLGDLEEGGGAVHPNHVLWNPKFPQNPVRETLI
jgi:hypothetical protein